MATPLGSKERGGEFSLADIRKFRQQREVAAEFESRGLPKDQYQALLAPRVINAFDDATSKEFFLKKLAQIRKIVDGGYGVVGVEKAVFEALSAASLLSPRRQIAIDGEVVEYNVSLPREEAFVLENMDYLRLRAVKKEDGSYDFNRWELLREKNNGRGAESSLRGREPSGRIGSA